MVTTSLAQLPKDSAGRIRRGSISMQVLSFFLLGADSFACGLVIGPFTGGWRRKLLLASLFGVCDGAATVMRHGLGLQNSFPAPAIAAAYLILVWLTSLAFSKVHDKLCLLPFWLCI